METETEPKKAFRIFPSPPVRISDVTNGTLDLQEHELTTVFGTFQKVVILGTILDVERVAGSGEKKDRTTFLLDDGTATIHASSFGAGAGDFEPGDIVVALCRPGEFQNEINLVIDRLRRVSSIDEELLHETTILENIQALKKAGKPIVMEGGGKVVNRPDEVSQFFGGKGRGEKIEGAETPIKITADDILDFEPTVKKVKPTAKKAPARSLEDGDEEEPMDADMLDVDAPVKGRAGPPAGKSNAPTRDAEPEAEDGEEGLLDEDSMKEMIMQTMLQFDSANGVEISELVDNLGYKKGTLIRYLKIMENEGIVVKIKTNPETYKPN
jgi:hypothetical protein